MILLFALTSCSGKIDINSSEDLATACEALDQEEEIINITFLAANDGCEWGEDGNGERTQGLLSARREDVEAMDFPEGGVACDLDFDFSGLNPDFEQEIVYDDHFLLTYNDVILASSSSEMVEKLDQEETGWYLYDWDGIYGQSMPTSTESYCLGEESECEVPKTEEPGPIRLSFSGDLVQELGFLGLEQNRYEFGFISMGDNDDSDCSHEAFTFKVVVPVVYP